MSFLKRYYPHPAIVLDIDQTVLIYTANVNGQIKNFDPPLRNEAIYKLYQYAVMNGISVFFITARDISMQKETSNDLLRAGYSIMNGLFLKPKNIMIGVLQIGQFKTNIRQKITKAGYSILLNIGDQDQDLIGGFSERTIKVDPIPTINFTS